jgi:phenylpropionate dioxygenase-like ring-hydroxylating dioxygenase large terminal subunit
MDLKAGFDYRCLGTEPVSLEPYTSGEYFETERRRVFKRSWLCVGRVDEIPNAGNYFVKDIAILQASIIIARETNGVIQGFHNVCAHRGNKVARLRAGTSGGFVCGFHGWTYDLSGRLTHVPDEDRFFDFRKSDNGLATVATGTWNGFIYIHADPNPSETLEEWMGELLQSYGEEPFASKSLVATYSAPVAANWKLIVDLGQESYHFPSVHRRTIPDSYTSKDNPYAHFLSIGMDKRHRWASVYANPEHKPTMAEGLAFKYGPTVTKGAAAAGSIGDESINGRAVPEPRNDWGFDLIIIFPNSIITFGNGFYVLDNYWPLDVSLTLWDSRLYMNKALNAGERISQEFSKAFTRDLVREDMAAAEQVQSGLASGGVSHMLLSNQEVLLP